MFRLARLRRAGSWAFQRGKGEAESCGHRHDRQRHHVDPFAPGRLCRCREGADQSMFREHGDIPGKSCRGEEYAPWESVCPPSSQGFQNSHGSQTKAMARTRPESSSWPVGAWLGQIRALSSGHGGWVFARWLWAGQWMAMGWS